MKTTDKIGMIIGSVMAVGGFFGLVWKAIEATVYRFSNPDYTEIRAFMERPDVTITGLIFAGICFIGAKIALHYAEK